MIITIAGNLGSGKSTVCEILKNKYNFSVYSTGKIQRDYARSLGISTLEMNKLMNTNQKYDHIIDDEVVRISKEVSSPVVFDSRMAWHFVEKSLKVFLIVDLQVAAERVYTTRTTSVENYDSIDDAKKALLERAKAENERYKQIYGVDNLDYSNYDLIIDTTHTPAELVADIIYSEYFNKNIENSPTIFISPQNVYPTQTIREINTAILEQYRKTIRNNEVVAPIEIIFYDGNHYVINGHHRLLAALMEKKNIMSSKLINDNKYPFYKKEENLKAQLKVLTMSTIYDFEDIGNFRYTNYPDLYRGEQCNT